MIRRYVSCINASPYDIWVAKHSEVSVSPPAADGTADVDAILDAALVVFTDLGLRRATIDDVAKRAGVGRITVYRRIGAKPELVNAVLTRESQRLFATVRAAAEAAPDLAERVAESFATTVIAVRNNAVWQRLLSLETDSALQQLTLDGQGVLIAAVDATVRILHPELGDDIPSAAQLARAELMVRITHSVLLTPHVAVPLADHSSLAAFARDYLVPIAARDTR